MLVLSRKTNEKIVFPAIGASVQVVSTKPGAVRLGIEAPPDVLVYREEVLRRKGLAAQVMAPPGPGGAEALRKVRHAIRNRLNCATIGLALMRRELEAGMADAVQSTLDKVDQELRALRGELEGAFEAKALPRPPTFRRKALLVEDDPNECELLAGFLRLAGLEVDTAGDGTDALDYLRARGRPDVLLLDLILPRCDGASTVRAIRGDPDLRGLKIFAVSGTSPAQFGVASGPDGIDRWFPKPLDPEILLRELHRELGAGPG
jgi:carbon storage regulator CsrA